ncbi:unnamed protein product, partial [Phaeothamnion confervicola]
MLAALSPRREQFFSEVAEGLARFPPGSVSRIERFVKYCRGELQPTPGGHRHQPCEEYVEGLDARPWWETSEFPWVGALEAGSGAIADEFKSYMATAASQTFSSDSAHMSVMGPGWSGVRLQRLGRWIPENCKHFPQTVKLLKELEVPVAVRGVIFARQLPGTGVAPHSDGRNFILTLHLG